MLNLYIKFGCLGYKHSKPLVLFAPLVTAVIIYDISYVCV